MMSQPSSNQSFVYYFIGNVRTPFSEWLGCGTKLCKGHKKNPEFCHIRPETKVYPIGNEQYECDECHHNNKNKRPRSLSEIYLPDEVLSQETLNRMMNFNHMTEEESRELSERCRIANETSSSTPVPDELTIEEEKARSKRIEANRKLRRQVS